ncbi:MAG: hypothetical protein ACKV0T_31515 [Planctomycetales bacterium]
MFGINVWEILLLVGILVVVALPVIGIIVAIILAMTYLKKKGPPQ